MGTHSTSLLGLGVWAAMGWESPRCFPQTQGHAFPGRRAHGRGTVGRWTLPGRAQAVPGLPQGSACLASKGCFSASPVFPLKRLQTGAESLTWKGRGTK